MRVVDDQIEGYFEMQPELVGNVAFQILHGGVAATMLDSIGGVVAMEQLYRRATPEDLPDTIKKCHVWRQLICVWIILRRVVENILLLEQKLYV